MFFASSQNLKSAEENLGEKIFEKNSQNELCARLLSKYIANDAELARLLISQKSSALNFQKTKIQNGIAVKISTGTITIQNDEGGAKIKLSPSAKIEIPQANKTFFSATIPLSIKENAKIEDAKFSVGTGIISDVAKNRKITIVQSERECEEARRKIENRFVSVEKEFYQNLKSLYSFAILILSAENDLYDDEKSLKKIQTQGYEISSATYRSAFSKVESDKREIQIKKRQMESECKIFAKKCGENFSEFGSAKNFLPKEIPEVEELLFENFPKEDYAKIESAVYAKNLAQMKRDAKKNFLLSANAGMTFANSNAISNSTTADAGLEVEFRGISADAGISFPINAHKNFPIFSFAFSFDPAQIKLSKISDEQDALDCESENLEIEKALEEYENDAIKFSAELSDALWAKKIFSQDFEMYFDLEKDMSAWFEKGITSQSELNDARAKRQKAQLNILTSKIDLIICNANVRLSFVPRQENLEAKK